MSTITLTPKSIEQYAILGKPARISISKAMISFTAAAVKRLALKQGECFFLDIDDDGKLYYRVASKGAGFEIVNETKQKSMNAYGSGLLAALVHHKVAKEMKTIRFNLGEFKEGRWKLVPMPEKKKKHVYNGDFK